MLGCAVNGIGEASHADFGITGAKNEGLIFAHGEPLRKVPQDRLVDELFAEIDKSLAGGPRGGGRAARPPRAPSGSRRSRRRTPASSRRSGSPRWRPPRRPSEALSGGTALPMAGRNGTTRKVLGEDESPTDGRRFTRA